MTRKAVALTSGGLDSLLAARIIAAQDIELIPLYCKLPFYLSFKKQKGRLSDDYQREVYKRLGMELVVRSFGDDFLAVLLHPRHGYGSHLNPCIDCRILMLKTAKALMHETGASFIVTGEVVGQRPMSQQKKTLLESDADAGVVGLVLRPLSALLLPATVPEQNGWVARESLYDCNGRSRRRQFDLAAHFSIKEYSNPAGGCLLTDPSFNRRLKDLITRNALTIRDVELLKLGRHFRLSDASKLIVGRDEKENDALASYRQAGECLIMPSDEIAGPTALLQGSRTPELIEQSCAIAARYCDRQGIGAVPMSVDESAGKRYTMTAHPMDERLLCSLRL